MSFWPFLKSPFTDLTAHLVSHQNEGRCADMEMRAIDCMEAYGYHRGLDKCDALIKDFQECAGFEKQAKRFYVSTIIFLTKSPIMYINILQAMRMERHRQYWNGEKTKKDHYAESPRHDSY